MLPASSLAMGATEIEQYEERYSPTKPCELASTRRPMAASKLPPSLLVRRSSTSSAALLAAARLLDALLVGERIHIVVIESQLAGDLPELLGRGNARHGIFRGDLGQLNRRADQLLHAVGGEVAGGGVGRMLSHEDAHAQGSRTCFLQGLHLAQAHQGRELRTLADHRFHGACSQLQRPLHYSAGQFAQLRLRCCFGCRHSSTLLFSNCLFRPPSCGQSSRLECRRRPERSARLCRRCQRPHRASGHCPPCSRGSAHPARCRSGWRPSPAR